MRCTPEGVTVVRTVQSAAASPKLRQYVRAFAQRNVTGLFEEQAMPAYLETVIHFDFGAFPIVRSGGGAWETMRSRSVVGPHTFAGTSLRYSGTIDSFAIFLQPTALESLFGIPVSLVMESHYDADALLGAPIADLADALAETLDFRHRVRLAEAFLACHRDREPEETIITVATNLLSSRRQNRFSIPDVASRLHLSVRQFERSFAREIGITPKRFARVARFQAALDARVRMPERSWLDIATDTGYFDQMHLIHEFRSLGGMPPTRTLERLGDSRPSALAASG